MLAYVSEAPAWRWQGSVPYTMAQVQSTKIPISPPRAQEKKSRDLFLHFARQECDHMCMSCSMLRSTLKKIGGYLFFNTFVQIPAIWKRHVKQKPKPLYRFRFCLAEKQGFEPWLRFSRTTPLAGEPLRPLGYFSVCRILIAFLMLDYDSTRVSQCQ